MSAPPSVEILRARGSMSLRELTRRTAAFMHCVQMYEDVRAVLEAAERRGEVRVVKESEDFRETVWRAA